MLLTETQVRSHLNGCTAYEVYFRAYNEAATGLLPQSVADAGEAMFWGDNMNGLVAGCWPQILRDLPADLWMQLFCWVRSR